MATHKKKGTHARVTKEHDTHEHATKTHSTKAVHHKEHAVKKAPVKTSGDNDQYKNIAIIVLVVALVAVLYWALRGDGMTTNTSTQGNNVASASGIDVSAEVKAQMVAMSADEPFLGAEDAPIIMVEYSEYLCPYCKRFEDQTFAQIKENFIDTGVVKFVYKDFIVHGDSAQKASEAAECANEQGKFWEYHDMIFANQGSASDATNHKKWAESLGLDMTKFNACLASGKYVDEIKEDSTEGRAVGVTGTPGFFINGQLVSGAQPYDKFEQVICAQAPTSEPCANREPPVAVEITVLSDSKCGAACNTAQIKQVTQNFFPGATFKEIDAQSSEGKALIEKHDLTFAPSYLFDEALLETKSWKANANNFQSAFEKIEGGYKLLDAAVGAEWYYSEEKQQQQHAKLQAALGLKTGDNRPQVDFFVMSYCPYGNQAEELLKPVYDKLKDDAEFVPRYVIYSQGTGCYTDTDGTQLCSLHGEVELNQDIRELCVQDLYGTDAWFDFALKMNSECDSKNADTCWTAVAEGLGYETTDITSCFDENKLTFAREQYDLNAALGVSGSPSLFFEGSAYGGARTANGYLGALCAGFDGEKPAACDGVIAEAVPSTAKAQASC